jgi:MarR family transcriptional regulator, 2-MHQ and catechol-resistance regulon repressor
MSQKDLGIKLLRSGGNITMVLDNLEKKNLIQRRKDISDRRFYRIHLTESGHELIQKIFPKHVDQIHRRFAILNHTEQQMFNQLCKKLGLNNQKKNGE